MDARQPADAPCRPERRTCPTSNILSGMSSHPAWTTATTRRRSLATRGHIEECEQPLESFSCLGFLLTRAAGTAGARRKPRSFDENRALLRPEYPTDWCGCPKRWEAPAGQVARGSPRFTRHGEKFRQAGPAYRFTAPPPISAAIRRAAVASGRVESIFRAWFNCAVARGRSPVLK